jgi:hypothetical protein
VTPCTPTAAGLARLARLRLQHIVVTVPSLGQCLLCISLWSPVLYAHIRRPQSAPQSLFPATVRSLVT